MPTSTATAVSSVNVHAASYDAARVRRLCPRWDRLAPRAQRWALSYLAPDATRQTHNTTTRGMDRHHVAALSPSEPTPGPVAHLRVGTGTRDERYGRTDLHAPVTDVQVDAVETGPDYLIANGFLASNQANVADPISELGVVTDDGTLLNHARFEPIDKHSGRIVNLAVRLGFGPATTTS